MLIISQIGATIGWTMLAFANTLGLVFIARIVEGISGGNISVTQAYVADLVEPEGPGACVRLRRRRVQRRHRVRARAGGFLLRRYGFSAPFLTAAAIQLLTLLLTIFMLPESTSSTEREHVATFRDIWISLTDRVLAPILVQIWAFSLALYAWFGVFTLLLKEALGFSGSDSSYFFAGFGLISVVLQLTAVGGTNARFGARRTANIGILALLVGFLLVPFIHNVPTLLPTMLLFAFGMSITRPSLTALLTDRTPENQRGTILGVSSALDNLSGVLMPPVSTGVLGAFGPAWAGAPSAFWAAVALALGLRLQRKEQRESDASRSGVAPGSAAAVE